MCLNVYSKLGGEALCQEHNYYSETILELFTNMDTANLKIRVLPRIRQTSAGERLRTGTGNIEKKPRLEKRFVQGAQENPR